MVLTRAGKARAAKANRDAEELPGRIQALAQELQEMILWFTDGFEIPATVAITERYFDPRLGATNLRRCFKPPLPLQLNRSIRAKFAKEYYSSVVFEWETTRHFIFTQSRLRLELAAKRGPERVLTTGARVMGTMDLHSWFRSLSKEHMGLIKTLQVTGHSRDGGYSSIYPAIFARSVQGIRYILTDAGDGNLDKVKLVIGSRVFTRAGELLLVERYSEKGELLLDQ